MAVRLSYCRDTASGGWANFATPYAWNKMVDGSGSTTWVYDGRGRMSAETKTIDGTAYTTSFTYDAADRIVTASYPGGETVTTGYDGQGLPAGLYDWNTYVSQATYDAASRPDSITFGSGLITDYDYFPWNQTNGRGRVQRLAVGTLLDWRYTYDALGNVKTMRDVPNSDQRQCFGYDDLDRLTSAFTGNATCTAYSSAGLAPYSQTYTYNAAGNMMSKSDVGTYTYDAPVSGCTSGTQASKPHAVRQAGSGSFVYDCAGNVVQRSLAGRVQALTYDAESRLTNVSDSGLTTTFVYDGDGRRVKKVTPWATTVYVNDNYEQTTASAGTGVLTGDTNADCKLDIVDIQSVAGRFGQAWSVANARYDVNQDGLLDVDDVQAVATNWQLSIPGPCNRLTKRYYRLGGQLIGVRTNGELNYLHGDHLGSVSLLTDGAGQKVRGGEQRFHPFGTVRTGQPAFYPTERGYTGQRLDLSTDLMYYEARYYDPLLGRFVQADGVVPDPGNPQSLNRYSYVLNNPLRYVDSSGHIAIEYWGGGGGAAVLMAITGLAQNAGQQMQSLTAQMAPTVHGMAQTWSVRGNSIIAAADQLSQVAQNASQAGNTASPGGLDPKKLDPEKVSATVKKGDVLRQWGPHDGPGPLPERIASTFRSATYSEVELTEDITLYRSYGGKAGEIGSFWTRTQPTGPLQAQIDAAILPEWGNTMSQMARIRVPAGTIIYEGYAAEQLSLLVKLLGGGNQVYIPFVDPSWLMK